VELEVSGGEADAAFSPASIDLTTGETVKLAAKNSGSICHSVRAAGPDGEYEASDDFVSDPSFQRSGEPGVLMTQIDEPGVYESRRDFHPTEQARTITVRRWLVG
jgi:plastocyanin